MLGWCTALQKGTGLLFERIESGMYLALSAKTALWVAANILVVLCPVLQSKS